MKTETDRVRVKATISLDGRVWEESAEILRELGLSRSAFINITLGQLLRVYNGMSWKGVGDVVGTVFRHASNNKNRKK